MPTRRSKAAPLAKAAPRKPARARSPPKRKHSGPQATAAPKHVPAPLEPPTSKAPRGFIVIDGSNVANSSRQGGMPRLENIQRVHAVLVQDGYEPVIFVDAGLRHQIHPSEKQLFAAWEDEAFIVQVPRGVNGDEAVLEFANRRHAPVLSNDNYQDLEARYPWVRDRSRRIPYNLVRGELILYQYREPPAPLASPPPQPVSGPSPAPTLSPPAPSSSGVAAPQPVPVQQKHQNFRRPRPLPGPTAPKMPAPAPMTAPERSPLPTPPAPRAPDPRSRGRGPAPPRPSEAEWHELRQTLSKIFDERVRPGESIRADQFSEETRRAIPGFRPNQFGSGSFTKLIERMDDLFELARRGPNGQMASLEGPPNWPMVVLRRG